MTKYNYLSENSSSEEDPEYPDAMDDLLNQTIHKGIDARLVKLMPSIHFSKQKVLPDVMEETPP